MFRVQKVISEIGRAMNQTGTKSVPKRKYKHNILRIQANKNELMIPNP